MFTDDDDGLFTIELNDGKDEKGELIPSKGAQIERAETPRKIIPDLRHDRPVDHLFSQDRPAVIKLSEKQRKLAEFALARESVSQMNRGPVQCTFLDQAREYAGRTHEAVPHVPFFSYWPTYDAMSEAQSNWYFYWRSEVKKGNYPESDISYIFIHIYEIINEIGTDGPLDGFGKLCGLWKNYRDRYTSLDSYMVLWLQDHIAIHSAGQPPAGQPPAGKAPVSPGEFLSLLPDPSLISLFPDSVAAEYMNRPDAVLPIETISRFTDYKFYMSKFCRSENGGRLLEFIPAVITHINGYMLQTGGPGIFGKYKPAAVQVRKHIPYQNAIYRGDIRSIESSKLPYADYPPLRAFITAVIKHTENVLREFEGYKGRLRGFDLDKDKAAVIKSFVLGRIKKDQAEKREKITVDRDRILQLINDSNAVRDSLLSGIEAIMNTDAGDLESAPVMLSTQAPPAKKVEKIEPPVSAPDRNDDGILGSLTETGAKILRYIAENGCAAGETDIASEFPGMFIGMEIDGINDAALELFGDILLVNEDGKWLICDDFADDILKCFDLKGETNE